MGVKDNFGENHCVFHGMYLNIKGNSVSYKVYCLILKICRFKCAFTGNLHRDFAEVLGWFSCHTFMR